MEAVRRQMHRNLTMQPPRPLRRPPQLLLNWPPHDLQPVAHTGQQSIKHVVAEVTPARQELTDARLTPPADPRQLRLRDADLQHHLTQHIPAATHTSTIAETAIVL